MGIKRIVLSVLLGIFLVQTISALTIDIQIPDSFSQGEQIYFNYEITSNITQEVIFISRVSCLNTPVSLIQEERISLFSNLSYINTYNDITIDNSIEPQICTAYIQVLSPIQKIVSKNFSIITNPSFSFDIKLDKKIFIKNENIYLDYLSNVENPSITATLIYPKGNSKQIILPSSIKAEQIGTYDLEVTASKEGYKTITKKEQFGVIEGNAVISGETIGKEEEEGKNLFSNFTEKIKVGDKKYLFFVLIIFVSFIFIIILIIKRKRDAEYDALSN